MRADYAQKVLTMFISESGYRSEGDMIIDQNGGPVISNPYLSQFLTYFQLKRGDSYGDDYMMQVINFVIQVIPYPLLTRTEWRSGSFSAGRNRFVLEALFYAAEFIEKLGSLKDDGVLFPAAIIYCAPPITGWEGVLFRDLALFLFARSFQFPCAVLQSTIQTIIESVKKNRIPEEYTKLYQKLDMETMVRLLYESDLLEEPKGSEIYSIITEFYLQYEFQLFDQVLFNPPVKGGTDEE